MSKASCTHKQFYDSKHLMLPRAQNDNDQKHKSSLKSLNTDPETRKKVAIILGYYNGEKYISEQLESILDQTHPFWHIFIFDDSSEKEINLEIIKINQKIPIKISVGLREKNIGFVNNFLNSLSLINEPFKYFAFSDQDDVWHQNKLQRAVASLEQHPQEQPVLYCARTAITEKNCNISLGTSPLFKKPPSFANALVQSIAGGNTMVFNKAARDLIVSSSSKTEVVSHDWWCYQIITGSGGIVVYDQEPCLRYRQHSNNLVGANNSWKARFMRIVGLFQGRFRHWNNINLSALIKHKELLTPENQIHLDRFVEARRSHFIKRLFLFCRSGIYRQTLFGNLGLLLGIIINKV